MVAPAGRLPRETIAGRDAAPTGPSPRPPPHWPCLLEVRDDKWGPGVIGIGRRQLRSVNVELTGMVESNNAAIFRC